MIRTKNGRDDWVRTSDSYVPNVVLYQAELHPDDQQAVLYHLKSKTQYFFLDPFILKVYYQEVLNILEVFQMKRPETENLTKSQSNVLNAISQFIENNGFPPTSRELGEMLEITATSVFEQLDRLEKKGFIKRHRKTARSIELIRKTERVVEKQGNVKLIKIPVIGTIAAGQPLYAFENPESEILIDESSVGKGRFFALKVKGESMINAGIKDGDLVIIRRQPLAEPGEIVAAIIDDEATIKRLRITNGKVFLDPENEKFSPIEVTYRDDFRILGKMVSTVSIS